MVNVTHDAHDGGAGLEGVLGVLCLVEQSLLDGDHDLLGHADAEGFGHQRGGVVVDHLVDRRHDAHHHQSLDDLTRLDL